MRKLTTITFALGVSVALFAAPVAASEKGDQKLAEKAVLRQGDVPTEFAKVPTAAEGVSMRARVCEGVPPEVDASALAAPYALSAFQLDQSDQADEYGSILSDVTVFPKAGAAKRAFDAYQLEAEAEACAQAYLEQVFAAPGIDTQVTVGSFAPELDDKGSKVVVKGGDEFVGLSASVRRSSGGEPQFFEAVMVFARVGRANVRLVLLSAGTVPKDDVQAMTQVVVRRLAPAR